MTVTEEDYLELREAVEALEDGPQVVKWLKMLARQGDAIPCGPRRRAKLRYYWHEARKRDPRAFRGVKAGLQTVNK